MTRNQLSSEVGSGRVGSRKSSGENQSGVDRRQDIDEAARHMVEGMDQRIANLENASTTYQPRKPD